MAAPPFLMAGAAGVVYALNPLVAVKIRRHHKWERQQFDNEQAVYKRLGRDCPYILPYLYSTPTSLFLLRGRQDLRFEILADTYAYDPAVGSRWMWQMCAGAAFLEKQGIAHGDLRPDNVLLDHHGNLRLFDFGCALPVGQLLPAGTEPFARKRSSQEADAGTYGRAGPATETFALGSIYYSIKRGFYPHSQDSLDPITLIDMYWRREFAPLDDSDSDQIIHRCWHGDYGSVHELWQVFGSECETARETDEWFAARENECAAWIRDGGEATMPYLR